MAARSSARFLAPLALIFIAVAVIVVVGSSGGDDSSNAPAQPALQTRTVAPTPARRRSVYVVKQGDLLSTIAERTGVSVDRLSELNPGLDPRGLVPGQRLKLLP